MGLHFKQRKFLQKLSYNLIEIILLYQVIIVSRYNVFVLPTHTSL